MKVSSELDFENLLFDQQAFIQTLSHTSVDVMFFKNLVKKIQSYQKERFFQGIPAAELIQHRTWYIDQILIRLWQLFLGEVTQPIAIVAVGGYGRGELHPGSDIDIMILTPDAPNQESEKKISELNNFLWDIGLEPGLSVRSLDECQQAAKADITVISNLLESRLVCGPSQLYHSMCELTSADKMWSSQEFFQAKYSEQQTRYQKFHDTAYNLEPNIKESPGGLRDIHTIAWVAKRQYRARSLYDLLQQKFLTSSEYQALIEGQNFLWSLRFALHTITKRREDRLLFNYQRELALLFGYSDDDKRLAVEHFMKRYYRTVMEISRLNEMLLQLFQEAIVFPDSSEPEPINRRFQERNGFVEIIDENVFKKSPMALLEIFLVLEQYPELQGVRATTIRAIRNHRYLINDEFRQDLRCRSLFMEILKQPRGVTHELRRMNRYGVLAAYLPEFGNIVGQMQYDLFHVYTVDEHSLFVLRNIRRFSVPEFSHEFPVYTKLFTKISKPELLYIAALFHDIAKGRGGNHSELGASDARAFCQHHGLSQYDTDLVSWLVEQHLLLSMTAHRKDISDPDVVSEFANQVDTQERLNYLYLLTIADIRGTNPTLWNNWKEALLAELYQNTNKVLSGEKQWKLKRDNSVTSTQKEALQILSEKGFDSHQIEDIWKHLGSEYFIRYSREDIVWHTQGIANCSEDDLPLVLIRPLTARGDTELLIYTKNQEKLFANTTALLDRLDLTIVDARIITTKNDYTLDVYVVLEQSGEAISGINRTNEIRDKLKNQLKHPEKIELKIEKYVRAKHKFFKIDTSIDFHHDLKNNRTIMELTCNDRPGLLSRVGQAFIECGIQLQNAKIATYGARAEDTFFICNSKARTINHVQQNCLEIQLKKYLGDII